MALARASCGLALAACLAPAGALELRPAEAPQHAWAGHAPSHANRHATDAKSEDPAFAGWLAVLVALVCFGSFGVPIKSKAVQDAKVHPLVFQTYKTFWMLVTSWIVLAWEDFHFSWWGLLSGLFWVPAGIAAVLAVNNVGLAVGQATWQVTIVVVSFLWGGLVFHDKFKSLAWAIVAVVLLLIGLLGMTFIASRSSKQSKQEPDESDALLEGNAISKSDSLPDGNADTNGPPPSNGATKPNSAWRGGLTPAQRFGLGAALFNGIWGGSNLVPMKFAHLGGPRWVISFAIGSAIVNAALWVLYAGYLFMQSPGESVIARLPPMHFGVMKFAGTISGLLWSVGNFASMLAVKELGQAIGYSCVQASIFVSGLWGILLYGEIRGRNIVYWLCSASIALMGIVLMSKQKG